MYKHCIYFSYYNSFTYCKYQLFRLPILQICNHSPAGSPNRNRCIYGWNLYSFSGRFNNQLLFRSNYSEHQYCGNIYCHIYNTGFRWLFFCSSYYFRYNYSCSYGFNQLFRFTFLQISEYRTTGCFDRYRRLYGWDLHSFSGRFNNQLLYRSNYSEHQYCGNIYCHIYNTRLQVVVFVPVTTSVTITAVPTASINYPGSPFCRSLSTAQLVTLTGNGAYTGGTYTASPGGLTINSSTGAITPSTSTAGIYTVTYTIPASGGCSSVPVTTSVTITAVPTASINYPGSPFCRSLSTAQLVALTGTGAYTGGTYTASPGGLTINSSTGAITPSTSTAGIYTVTYTIPASGGCSSVPVTTSVTITAVPTASINYPGSPFCRSLSTAQLVALTGTGAYTGGTYTASPGGLTINSSTGAITPSTSTAGIYTVTYTIPASGGCSSVPVTTSVTITAVPTASINYPGSPFCRSLSTAQLVALTGTGAYTGGTYTASPGGLTINSSTGAITPSTSTAGIYTVTYTIPASGGCSSVPVTTSVTITAVPAASINYSGSPFCRSLSTAQLVALTGTGAYTGGTYTASPGGLTINSSTGAITPSTSTAGIYTVTYTIPASGGCSSVPVTTSVTITAVPTASINYSGSPFCRSLSTAQLVALTGTGAYTGGTYTASPGGLTINSSTGAITPSTSTAGIYTVTYTIPASGGCSAVPVTTLVTISSLPTATINYSGNPFCTNAGPANPTINILTGGPFNSTSFSSAAGLTINSSTGVITPGTSTPGTYTITYSFTGANGCTNTATTSVTITALPTARINYSGSPFCRSVTTAQPVALTGTGAFTGGTYTASPGGLTINSSTGSISPGTSTAGTYTVTYTILASGGCPVVPVTTSVTITAVPVATFSYSGTPYCSNEANPSPTFGGGGIAGTFSSTAGLVFVNASTGQINLTASTPGTYTVTNTIGASGGCAVVSVTSPVTITALPGANINYAGSPFCTSVSAWQSVTLTGTGAFSGGTFAASPAGLTLNNNNGNIRPSNSTAGTYTVTYTIPASGGCPAVPVATTVIITAVPVATFSYPGTPFCSDEANPLPAFSGGGVAGTFSSTAGLVFVSPSTGQINLAASTPGTYTVTNTIAASGGCAAVSAHRSCYNNSPTYC